MNIIDVLIDECRCAMKQQTFEINSVLANPTHEGSVNRASKAIYEYTKHETVLQNLLKLKGQMDEMNNTEVQEEVNEN
jgi:hypothetical protein